MNVILRSVLSQYFIVGQVGRKEGRKEARKQASKEGSVNGGKKALGLRARSTFYNNVPILRACPILTRRRDTLLFGGRLREDPFHTWAIWIIRVVIKRGNNYKTRPGECRP